MMQSVRRPTPRSQRRVALVLVVDDHEDTRELHAECLHAAGFRTHTACDGEEAVAEAHAYMPDLIVMDLDMPRLDGLGATRALKADPATCQIVIVVVTGRPLPDGGRLAYEAGCDGFLTKPISSEALGAAVKAALAARPVGAR